MAISLTCECGKKFEAPDEKAGHLARCPECAREVLVPDSKTGVQEDAPRSRTSSREVTGERPEPRRRRREEDWDEPERKPAQTSGKAIASLVLGFLSCGLSILTGIPGLILGIMSLSDINRSRGRLKGHGLAVTGIILNAIGTILIGPALLIAMLLPAVQKVRDASNRMQSQNNLKQIGLAMHNYHSTYQTFPPSVIQEPGGQPYSWRVALLPYLEQAPLYQQYHRNEPWDSPNNRRVLDTTVKVYLHPSADLGDLPEGPARTLTYYQVVVGEADVKPGPAFEDWIPSQQKHRGIRIADFTDGTSNTLLIAEATDPVPWTKPVDLNFTPDGPLPRLGLPDQSVFNVLIADGSIRPISRKALDPKSLEAMITRNGGEIITLP